MGRKIKKYGVIILIIFLILLDQIGKLLILEITKEGMVPIFSDQLAFEVIKNTGGAFGFGAGNITMFILTNVIILGIIIRFLITQKEQMDQKTKVVLSLILAGGFSNLLDRIVRGYVVDYLKIENFPVFNLADCFIVIGWVTFCFLIAKYTWFEVKRKKEKEKGEI